MIDSVIIENNNEIIFDKAPDIAKVDECGTQDFYTSFIDRTYNGWYKEQIFDNFKIGYGALYGADKKRIRFNFNQETIGLIFILKGSLSMNINNALYTNHFEINQHNIFYYTSANDAIEITDNTVSIVRINFKVDFFNQFLPADHKFENFRKQIKQHKNRTLEKHNYQITTQMHLIIDNILHCKRKGFYRKISMNALVFELLLLQLDMFNQGSKKDTHICDTKKIIKVKEYLDYNYTLPMTLEFLCKKFGTNEFALKKGFKSTFGKTVFGYISDLKMHKARNLLMENNISIGEVSEIIGYKNAQHFSTAFKKKFGMTPSKCNSFTHRKL
ncbi:helix-turn-helix transcriptional regulator [Formosa sediminum]|uniref:Helix-turn-helix transcriptional regulator n=1 Tax=Formosa sediminum TaxID=2594004 RepID=A0A516GUQ4_9FLAO|nr:AraC family transcriptional regulator [Formosa sediminum]QDO95254.1 helix-turn-helix transcriptional regulator [Formosa sediminum]